MFYERSLYTDRYIFARNCWETELMTDLEFDIYSDWSDYLLDTQGDVHIHGVIYLRADPKVSHARLNKRSRVEEKGITLEYLGLGWLKILGLTVYKKFVDFRTCQ